MVMRRERDFFPQGVNQYVPAMQYVAEIGQGGIVHADLGALPAYDQDGIDDAADGDGATDLTVYAADMDGASVNAGQGTTTSAEYGQTIVLKVSGDPGAGGIDVDFYGEDYLGQPMKKRLTVASGATAEVESTCAFKRIIKHVLANPATNAITFDVGWGNKYGLPYKILQLLGGSENGVSIAANRRSLSVAGVDAGAGTTAGSITAPYKGYIIGATYEVTTAQATSAATLDAVVDGTGQATLDLVVPVSAIGESGDNFLPKSGWIAVDEGDTITFTSDSGGDTGVVVVTVHFAQAEPDIAMPVTTDPGTATTGDPRGLYDPQTAPNGTYEYDLRYFADNSVNTSGNGGLHGIEHYIA